MKAVYFFLSKWAIKTNLV